MKKSYYAIYDNLGQQYMTPILFDNDQMAIRWFKGVVNNKENDTIFNNPADYELHKIGTFDFMTGYMEGESSKLVVGKAVKNGEK